MLTLKKIARLQSLFKNIHSYTKLSSPIISTSFFNSIFLKKNVNI